MWGGSRVGVCLPNSSPCFVCCLLGQLKLPLPRLSLSNRNTGTLITLLFVVNIETSECILTSLPLAATFEPPGTCTPWGWAPSCTGTCFPLPPCWTRPLCPLPRSPGVSWAAGFAVILGAFVVATTVFVTGSIVTGYRCAAGMGYAESSCRLRNSTLSGRQLACSACA